MLNIQTFDQVGIAPLAVFISQYRQAFPDAKLMSAEFYLYHPLAEGGRNVLGAFDGQNRPVGLAAAMPAPVAEDSPPDVMHHIWTIILAQPDISQADEIRDGLLERVIERAHQMRASFTLRPTRLASDLMISQRPEIDYLTRRGFAIFDVLYVLRRDLADPIPDMMVPAALTMRRWRMSTDAEQRGYIAAFNRCFPENPQTWETLQFFLRSSAWETGTAIAAWDDQERLVGSVLVFEDKTHQCGIIDDVFVLPEWRGRGVARCLVAEGLRYLREQGVAQVMLEVRRDNASALAVYRAMGYRQVNQEVMLGMMLDEWDFMIENALNWAQEQLGTTDYRFRCLAFVEDAYEQGNRIEMFGGSTAHESAEEYGLVQQDILPPKGSLVFYDCWGVLDEVCPGEYKNWGHVGLSLGDGRVIHAWDRVRIDDYRTIESLSGAPGWSAPRYAGWTPVQRALQGYRSR